MSNDQELYSNQWNNSSEHFYNNDSYSWMCDKTRNYKTILEIGSGTGQSTLSLLEAGHKVICIEKNRFCIEKANSILVNKGYKVGLIDSNFQDCDVIFLCNDLFDNQTLNILNGVSFDLVICWNVGSYWNKEMIEYYLPHMLRYGLTIEQIRSNPESSYVELVIWESFKIASERNVPIHIIDRSAEKITSKNADYFIALKREFNYLKIQYDNKKVSTLSTGGRSLTCNGQECTNEVIDIYLNSIFIS